MQKINHKVIFDEFKRAKIGKKVIPFSLKGINAKGDFINWDIENNFKKGEWTVIFFYPADFSFVCPTEIKGFSSLASEFLKEGSNLVGVSVDSPFVHLNWTQTTLGKIEIPLLSDQNALVAKYFGVYQKEEGVASRGTFIISPEGTLYVNYSTLGEIGRSPLEVLRLLRAAKLAHSGELVPCEWQPGDKTIIAKK